MSKIPLLNERIYAPYKIAALVEVLGDQGISAEASLAGADIAPDRIYDPHALTSVRQYLAVCSNAVRLECDPATPFLVGRKMHLSAYGMYGYALLCSETMRDYFNLGVKYHRLATPTLSIHWREDPGAAVWYFQEQFTSAPSPELRRFLIEQQLAQHVTHINDSAGKHCMPLKVHASYPTPHHLKLYKRFLHCPVCFDQPASELYYDSALLELKPQLSHRITSALLQETCDRLIGSAKTSAGVAGETYQVLMRTPGQFPTMNEVARILHMTSRTLRRRLEAEGMTFAAILADVRRSLATEYLRTTKMTTEDIAGLLGFSDAANFRHAFKRWTGKAPSDYRGMRSR